MVLRPNYYPSEQQPNMQYSPPNGPPPNWQGAPAPSSNQHQDYQPPLGPPPSARQQYPPPAGEGSGYYGGPQQPQNYQQPVYGQQYGYYPPPAQYSNYPPPQYENHANQQPMYCPPGPYGYEHPGPNPFGQPPALPDNRPEAPPVPGNRPEPPQVPSDRPEGYGNPEVKQEEASPVPGSGPQTDEERGLMGAIAGGAAGGYAGHKVHHGFLGALGGAYAGHKLEDAYKEHKKHSRPSSPVPPPQPHHEPTHHNSGRVGNFSHSSKNMSLDGDYDLIASCRNIHGHEKLSSISLNAALTNDNGRFRWVDPGSGPGNFGGSARNVRLIHDGKTLEAELRCIDGNWQWDQIELDERITNADGDLRMV